eukprot:NODE_2768_length_870_cov_74.008526_g2283_i0.p2 GENE.NODE_2768_length_870_cov_74.008526_g2283_i0~~NODE_2768_length_870_cov_74.008526_g2283_i0.p2  ORF type:complete len:55 (-),score=8.70 NODE_2768_length_870_cov_74.008526_g2283_i0:106-270(-)
MPVVGVSLNPKVVVTLKLSWVVPSLRVVVKESMSVSCHELLLESPESLALEKSV